jgi:hypothetical protein
MTESGFTQSIMRKLDKRIYKWKIMNTMQNGVPDCYFSGPAGDLWVEVKYIKLPKRELTEITPKLSDLQLRWLTQRKAEGRNVAVILGSEQGSCLYHINESFEDKVQRAAFNLSRNDVVKWIETQTLG